MSFPINRPRSTKTQIILCMIFGSLIWWQEFLLDVFQPSCTYALIRDNVINSKFQVFPWRESLHASTAGNHPMPVIVFLCLFFISPGIMSCVLLKDILALIKPSNTISRIVYMALQFLLRPFRDYMQLEDMAEYDPEHPVIIKSPQWKKWFLFVAGVIPGIIWGVLTLFLLALGEYFETGPGPGICTGLISFSWVSHHVIQTSCQH